MNTQRHTTVRQMNGLKTQRSSPSITDRHIMLHSPTVKSYDFCHLVLFKLHVTTLRLRLFLNELFILHTSLFHFCQLPLQLGNLPPPPPTPSASASASPTPPPSSSTCWLCGSRTWVSVLQQHWPSRKPTIRVRIRVQRMLGLWLSLGLVLEQLVKIVTMQCKDLCSATYTAFYWSPNTTTVTAYCTRHEHDIQEA